MKDKIKEILINRLGQIVNTNVLDELSTKIDEMVRHEEFLKSGRKDNITIGDVINKTANLGDVFKYGDDYYKIIEDNTHCGFAPNLRCKDCPFDANGCMNLKDLEKFSAIFETTQRL